VLYVNFIVKVLLRQVYVSCCHNNGLPVYATNPVQQRLAEDRASIYLHEKSIMRAAGNRVPALVLSPLNTKATEEAGIACKAEK
jgi:hypothetical protein